jgi:hypothetical protein
MVKPVGSRARWILPALLAAWSACGGNSLHAKKPAEAAADAAAAGVAPDATVLVDLAAATNAGHDAGDASR